MKFKKMLLVVLIVLALVVPDTAFAATSTSTTAISALVGADSSKLTSTQSADVQDNAQKDWCDQKGKDKIDTSKLTDQQKTSLLALQKQQLSLENDLATILVQQNLITQAQADSIKAEVNAKIASLSTTNLSCKIMGCGMRGLSLLRGVTITDAQKAAILGWAAKSADVQKKIVVLYKDAGVINQAQADTINQKIDARAADPLAFTKKGHGKMDRGHGDNTGSAPGGSKNSAN